MNIEEEIQQLDEQRQQKLLDLKNELMGIRRRIVKCINYYNERISEEQKKLDEINKRICSVFGHDFTPWEEHPDKFQDRSWYYDRQCMVCGEKERTDDTPKEYITKGSNGRTYIHKRYM